MRFDSSVLRVVFLVARRDFLTRVRTRFFVIGTVAMVVIVAGYVVLQATVLGRTGTTVKIAFYGPTQALAKPLAAAAKPLGVTVHSSTVTDLGAAEAQVRKGSLDAVVSGDPGQPTVDVKDTLQPAVLAAMTDLVRLSALNQALTARGVDPASVSAAVAAAHVNVETLDPQAAQRTERQVAGVVVAILLYVILLMYGQIVAAGVVEEKANRIVEILLATIQPRQLLLGKVIGIGLVGALQMVIVGAAALLAVARTHVVDLPTVGVTAAAGGVLWFVLGFLLYALVYAAAGSLVSRQEDLAGVLSPLTALVVGTYLAFFWVIANPTNAVAIAISMLPPFAPILMPARMASGDASAWQVLVAVALIVPTIAAVNWLGARIYQNSVMRMGVRVRLRDAWAGRG